MAKLHRPLSDQSKAYKIVEEIFDKMVAPRYLEDAVIQKLPFEQAYGNYAVWYGNAFVRACHRALGGCGKGTYKHESVKRYIRHIVAKRRKKYEVLISMPFMTRLGYFIIRTVRG